MFQVESDDEEEIKIDFPSSREKTMIELLQEPTTPIEVSNVLTIVRSIASESALHPIHAYAEGEERLPFRRLTKSDKRAYSEAQEERTIWDLNRWSLFRTSEIGGLRRRLAITST